MVRRRGDSYRRQVARQRYNFRRQQTSPMMSLANLASQSISPPSRPANYYGNRANEVVNRQLRTIRRYARDWFERRRERLRLERQRRQLDEIGFVPTVEDAADNVENLDVYESTSSQKQTRMSRSRFIGNFKKPHPYSDNWEAKCLKNGYVWHEEIYGSVTDANSAYITHATMDMVLLTEVMCMTWFRKMFEKAGITISDRSAIIPLNSITAATGGRIEYHEQNPVTGVVTTLAYEMIAGETLTTLLQNFTDMKNAIAVYLQAGTSVTIPWQLCFYSYDLAAVTSAKHTLSSSMDLNNEVLDIYISSELKVQNRTSPDQATAGDQSTDRSDIQPLVGTIYNFSGDPKLRKIGTNNADQLKLQGVSLRSLKLNRSADFVQNSYHNRPPAQIFSNCVAKSNVVLQPGDVKRGALFYHLKGTIHKLYPKLKIDAANATIAYSVRCKSQMMVFEELLRTSGTNQVKVQYERKLRIGCLSYTKKAKVPLIPMLSSGPLSIP